MTLKTHGPRARRRLLAGAAGAALLLAGPAAQAQATTPSDRLAVNLVRLLVKQGTITQAAADILIHQAEAETEQARVQEPVITAPSPTPTAAAPVAVAVGALPEAAAGAQRIFYVPQIVRDQIRDEVKTEVMQQAKTEGWADPGKYPAWLDRFSFSGDLRFRDQSNLYDGSNVGPSAADPSGGLVDFATFNQTGPIDINPQTNLAGVPILNTRKDRTNLLSIRARLAIDFAVTDGVRAGVRLATGDNNGPVSTTQLLGGGFAKKDVWVDRAFITVAPRSWVQATFGRMANPFLSTELLFDEDLNFDGVSAGLRPSLLADQGFRFALTGGAFPVEYQAQNFPTNDTDKRGEASKWLFAGQATASWGQSADLNITAGAAYYTYVGTRGQLSTPCAVYAGQTQCSTDFTRALFLQKGNTLFFTRDLLADPTRAAGSTPLPQLAGLVFDYDILDLILRLDIPVGNQRLILAGDYARNLGYDVADLCVRAPNGPITNVVAGGQATNPCQTAAAGDIQPRFESGPNAFHLRATYGNPSPAQFGDWNITGGYRYIEPDAVLDAFNDNDFHLGGTNAQGYYVAAAFGLFPGTVLQARWFSAREVKGPRLTADVGQVDLNVRF